MTATRALDSSKTNQKVQPVRKKALTKVAPRIQLSKSSFIFIPEPTSKALTPTGQADGVCHVQVPYNQG